MFRYIIPAVISGISLAWDPFLESPGNLPGPISDFGDKCFLAEVKFC